MEKCEHGLKITHFCIYQYCAAKEAGGCLNCIKKYHSHVGHGETLRTEEVDLLAEKFNIQNSVKPKCRQFQENVFSFFTQIKTQIQQTIDIVCKGMVNKIGYPFLSHLNHLSSYKRIKNKEYKKLTPKELKKIHADCRGLDVGSVTVRERELYVEQIVQNFAIVEGMERLMKEYENLAKRLCKNFRHDSLAYRKIQDLKKYLNTVLKLDKRQISRLSDNDSKQTQKLLQTSPSDQRQFPLPKSSLGHHTNQTQPNPLTTNNQSLTRLEPQLNSSRSKYKKYLRNYSIEREFKVSEFGGQYEIKITPPDQVNSYESKEKEILERKEKLMKMMSMKEKSLGMVGESARETGYTSTLMSNDSGLILPPLLKYQKNLIETHMQKQRPKKFTNIEQPISKKTQQPLSFFSKNHQQQTCSNKKQLSTQNLLISPRTIKHSNSVHSIQDQLTGQKHSTKNEQDQQDKYKYGMVRLPSSESNSSETDIFFKSYLQLITKSSEKNNKRNIDESLGMEEVGRHKQKRDRMTQSTPIKIQLNGSGYYSGKLEDVVTDQEKSAGLYLMGLEKSSTEECIKYLKAALSYCPRNISAAQQLSFEYLSNNKLKQCLDLCTQYLILLTKLSKPELKRHFITNKSAALNSLGRYSESIMLLESELVNFDQPKMYKNLGDAYYFVGINQKCQYNYEKAIRLNPKLDEAMYNLAACIFTQGNFFNADIWISKALAIDPKNVEYQTLKKEVQKRLADVQKETQE